MLRHLLLPALALLAASCHAETRPARQLPQGQPLCIGRYDLAVPQGARPVARGQTIRHLRLRADPVPPGTTLDAAVAVASRPGLGSAEKAAGGRRTAIGPDTALLTRDWVDGIPVTDTAAVRLLPGLVLTAQGQHDEPAGVGAQRETAIALVASAVPLGDPEAHRGFCIDGAAIGLPFRWQEEASAGFAPPGGGHLSIQVSTIGDRPGRGLLDGAGGTLGRMAAMGVGTRTVRSGRRVLAGHAGEELVIARTGRNEALLQWLFVGEPRSGTAPRIEIRLEARDVQDLDALLAEWDAMLGSLRRRAD
ncbi:T6SS immunity protein Tli4 family protein [Muricoccus radiodurans]|uniref:T6SS immunity protein Tli4 family protein n=1 Tax=Muricoccus radiodurans TaxID=2231721 RepID=UPI003CF39358